MTRTSTDESWVHDVSFDIYPGELVALIGSGDSGKTTLLRMIMGLSQPDSGKIRVFGHEPGSIDALQKSGAVLDTSDFPGELMIHEVIELVRAHYANPAPVKYLAERCGFDGELDRSVDSLELGEKRWLAVLLSLAGSPDALFMDMPTMGMDVAWRRRFWNLVSEHTGENRVTFLTTDVLHEVEVFASRVIIVHKGRVVADGAVHDVIAEHGERTLSMRSESVPDIDGIGDVEWRDGGPVLHPADADTVVRELAKQDFEFEELEVRRPDLEEVLLRIIEENGG